MKAYFNIYGLSLEVTAKHPALFDIFVQELRTFRADRRTKTEKMIHLTLQAIPAPKNGDVEPWVSPLISSGIVMKNHCAPHTFITRYGRSFITVISRFKQRKIHTYVVPGTSLLPDPVYFYCFTEPMSLWFKQRGLFFLHAGCVSQDSKGVLIAGPSRAGKSTLSMSAIREGFKFVADEQPLLSFRNDHFRVDPFPRRIRLDRLGAVETLSRLLQDDHFIWYKSKPWDRISQQHLTLLEKLSQRVPSFVLEYGVKDIRRTPSLFRQLLRK